MIVNSRTIKGKCAICGVAHCACGGPTTIIAVDTRVSEVGGGPLIKIDLGRGRSVKLTEEMAKARGLLPKQDEPASDKRRRQASNKARG